MKKSELEYISKALAKSTSAAVRLYEGETQIFFYSIHPIQPDPFLLYEEEILRCESEAGILTTALFQFYGYVSLGERYRIIIGPTAMLAKDRNKLESLMFLLEVAEEKREEYVRKLECAPSISAERMSWFLSFISSVINQKPLPVESVLADSPPRELQGDISNGMVQNTFLFSEEKEEENLIADSYENEKIILFYIKNGQAEHLGEMLKAMPKMKAGVLAQDTLRQVKNMGICCAAVASRAAIDGGLNAQNAFRLSDLYIQKFELLRDPAGVSQLINQMLLDYAKRTRLAKYSCSNTSGLFLNCAYYVSENLFQIIRVEEMAVTLGMSRAHLCNQFHRQTGVTLTQYILREKTIEAQRLLRFTDKSISEIALHLAFSSQSHFQTVFKKYAGVTPNKYRAMFPPKL